MTTGMPYSHMYTFFVVGGGDEPFVIVHEQHAVHGAEVFVIRLHDFIGSHVPLYHLLVHRPHQHLIVVVRVDFPTARQFFIGVLGYHLARLCVPKLDVTVVTDGDEASASAPSTATQRLCGTSTSTP